MRAFRSHQLDRGFKFSIICMNLMNLVCIGESEDCRGNITHILVESDYAKEYRIKKAEQQKRWYEKKKASQPLKEKKQPMTKEERSRRVMAYQKEYYATHPEKLAERREKNRVDEKARRERKKAEKLASQAAMANVQRRGDRRSERVCRREYRS